MKITTTLQKKLLLTIISSLLLSISYTQEKIKKVTLQLKSTAYYGFGPYSWKEITDKYNDTMYKLLIDFPGKTIPDNKTLVFDFEKHQLTIDNQSKWGSLGTTTSYFTSYSKQGDIIKIDIENVDHIASLCGQLTRVVSFYIDLKNKKFYEVNRNTHSRNIDLSIADDFSMLY